MSAIQPRVVLRPRSFLETGDLAIAFIRRHPRAFVTLLPWVLVPFLAEWAFVRFVDPEDGLRVTAGIASAVLGSVACGIYTRLCGELLLHPDADLRALQRRFVADLPRWLVTRVAAFVLTYGSAFLLFRSFALLPETMLLERAPFGAARRRSSALLGYTPGRATALLAATMGLVLGGSAAATLGRHAVLSLFGFTSEIGEFLQPGFVESVTVAVVYVYLSVVEFLLYIDCRTRAEGWDLQVEMASLVESGGRPATRREAA